MPEPKINKIYSRQSSNVTTFIYLSGQITGPEDYIEEIQSLREATAGDKIEIYINTEGGNVHTAIQWVNAIRNCEGTITGVIDAICHSAGTYIFLACDQWRVNKNCLMMIHNYSSGAYGKGEELVHGVISNDKWVKAMMSDIYDSFLTADELEKVIEGKDLYLTSEEILERLPQVMDARKLEEDIAQEEAINSVREQFKQLEEEEADEGSDSTGIQECPAE